MKVQSILYWTVVGLLIFSPQVRAQDAPAWTTFKGSDGRWHPRGWSPPANNNNNSQQSPPQQSQQPQGPSEAELEAQRQQQEAQRQQQLEAERRRHEAQEAAAQAAFEVDKRQALANLKGITSDDLHLKSIDSDSPAFALKGIGNSDTFSEFKLKGLDDSIPKLTDTMVRQEQDEFEKMNAAWMRNQQQLIQQRLQEPNRWASAFYASLKTKEPPLPYKKFAELQPGDVLLISPDGILGDLIRGADRLSTWESKSPASHTVLFLKEVNGKKLFLDDTAGVEDTTSGRGPHIITEQEFLKTYGKRDANVAEPAVFGVAQPLNKDETARLWATARALGIKELASEPAKAGNHIDTSNFGLSLYGVDHMVCSEAAHTALVGSGRNAPDTKSPLKKLLGISFGPANFFSDEQDFIVTPLGVPK